MELIRFGSVHWCPVLPHVSEGREAVMSEADRARYRKARAAGIAQHGDNVMLDCFHPPPSLIHSPALPCSKLRWSLEGILWLRRAPTELCRWCCCNLKGQAVMS